MGIAGSNLRVTGCAAASCVVVESGSVEWESRESARRCEYGDELTPDRGATSSGKSFTTRPDGDLTCMLGTLHPGIESDCRVRCCKAEDISHLALSLGKRYPTVLFGLFADGGR